MTDIQADPFLEAPGNLRCEHQVNPLAVEACEPRLSWIFAQGQIPSAVQVQAASTPDGLRSGTELLWDSGWVDLAAGSIRYGGPERKSYDPVFWRVRFRDAEGCISAWSETACWRTGVLQPEEWRGRWIGYSEPLPGALPDALSARDLSLRDPKWIWAAEEKDDVKPRLQQAQRSGTRYSFSRTFECAAKPDRAALRMAVDGIETFVRVNGVLVDLLSCSGNGGADSWVLPLDLEIAPFLKAGSNTLEVSVHQTREHEGYGFQAVLAVREEGQVRRILTDDRWQAIHVRTGEPRSLKIMPPLWAVPRQVRRIRDDRWGQTRSTPLLRRVFNVERPVRSAILSVCGLGFYELTLDGERVGDRELDPAFTNYNKRVLYTVYDLTDQLLAGSHELRLMLGNGWYNQCNFEIFDFDIASWRDEPKVLLQLRIEYQDGEIEWIVSDSVWDAARSPVVLDGIRNGEVYDARLEEPATWRPVQDVSPPAGRLTAAQFPPEQVVEILEAEEIKETPRHSFLFRFPRNISGRPRLKVRGPRGTRVVMRCFEAPDNRLEGWTHQGPFQTDVYILKGDGEELYEPRFTYHGFQFIELTGYPGEPDQTSLTASVVHTALESIGSFRCSSPLLNQIQSATCNAFLSNFHGFPTDCPTREKSGWTADAYLAAETGLLNFDMYAAYAKWVEDLLDAQHENGSLPDIVPTDTWGYNGFFDWDCVVIQLPWQIYLYTGEIEILLRTFSAMKACYDHYAARAENDILDRGRGDWAPETSVTPKELTVTALLFDCARTISKTSALLGRDADRVRYEARASEIKAAFVRDFLNEDGVVANGTQTAQSCALYFDLVPEEMRPAVLARLVDSVHAAGNHVDVGIFGAKYLFRVLSDNGFHELACTIALQKTFPGYGWWIEKGYTSLPESWAVIRSANHIMFGDISAWFFSYMAGIRPVEDAPGFRRFKLRPHVCGQLEYAEAEYQSSYGKISSAWRINGETVEYRFEVPPGTVADVDTGQFQAVLPPGIHFREEVAL